MPNKINRENNSWTDHSKTTKQQHILTHTYPHKMKKKKFGKTHNLQKNDKRFTGDVSIGKLKLAVTRTSEIY